MLMAASVSNLATDIGAILGGGTGNDTLFGNINDDVFYSADGNDLVTAMDGEDTIYGAGGNDVILANAGDDLVFGGSGNDNMSGGEGRDFMYGGAGLDTIIGGAGDDVLRGRSGNDRIEGENGADLIVGGTGNDTLIGGSGADAFFFEAGPGDNVIEDFSISEDSLEFSMVGLQGTDADYRDLLEYQNTAEGVVITYDASTILLEDVNISSIEDLNLFFVT